MEEKKNKSWTLYDQLKGSGIGFYNLYSKTIRLLFLKYMITYPDKLSLSGIDSYNELMEFRRKYDNARNGNYVLMPSDVAKALNAVESCKGDSNIRLEDALNGLDFLFNERDQRVILNAVDNYDLPSDKKELTELFKLLIDVSANDVRMTGEATTNKSLRELASKLLKVDSNDVFLNCYAGYSSILFDVDEPEKYLGYEINNDSAITSLLTSIMLGVKNFSILKEDYLTANTDNTADKVFSDGPISIKREDIEKLSANYGIKTRDADVYGFYKAYYSLKDNGKCLIAVPGKYLFSSQIAHKDLRKTFSEVGLKAVIALPPMWQGTAINTNLIYLEKDYKDDVVFVDASKLGYMENRTYFLTEENISKIVDAIDKKKTTKEFSAKKDRRDVTLINSWLMSNYISYETKKEYRDIKVIDKELQDLYSQLNFNNK